MEVVFLFTAVYVFPLKSIFARYVSCSEVAQVVLPVQVSGGKYLPEVDGGC